MTINHVGRENVNELLTKVIGKTQENILDSETIKEFYKNRITFLENQSAELEKRQQQIEKSITEQIQHILTTEGAELLSIKQLWELVNKEIGACEYKVSELKDEEKAQ